MVLTYKSTGEKLVKIYREILKGFWSFADTYVWRSEVVEGISGYELNKTWVEPETKFYS